MNKDVKSLLEEMIEDVIEDKKQKWKEKIDNCIEEFYFENDDMEIDGKKKKKKKNEKSDEEEIKKAEEIFKEMEKSRISGK